MRRFILTSLIALTASLAFAQGTITELRGKVEVQLPGQTQWRAATQGMRVPLQATISTGFNATASIRVNASTVRLRPMTRVKLETLAADAGSETVDLRLNVGRVNAEVRRGDANEIRFTVRSPQATASVRGTDFEMDPYSLTTFEGLVDFDSGNGPESIPAGGNSVVTILGNVAAARDLFRERPLLRFGPDILAKLRELGWRPDAGFGGKASVTVVVD